jgi:hypothetical protein
MPEGDNQTAATRNHESHEGDGHSTVPQVQTPDKPSQAEGDRETVEASISEKESEGGTPQASEPA